MESRGKRTKKAVETKKIPKRSKTSENKPEKREESAAETIFGTDISYPSLKWESSLCGNWGPRGFTINENQSFFHGTDVNVVTAVADPPLISKSYCEMELIAGKYVTFGVINAGTVWEGDLEVHPERKFDLIISCEGGGFRETTPYEKGASYALVSNAYPGQHCKLLENNESVTFQKGDKLGIMMDCNTSELSFFCNRKRLGILSVGKSSGVPFQFRLWACGHKMKLRLCDLASNKRLN